MRASLIAGAAGLLFGLGLTVSGMIDPAKVLGFLDVAGNWDPSLALVLISAVGVAAAAFRVGGRRQRPFAANAFQVPLKTQIDAPLVAGAVLFGVGWGLAGYCPGPMLAALALGKAKTWEIAAAMILGMAAFELWTRLARWPRQVSPGAHPGQIDSI